MTKPKNCVLRGTTYHLRLNVPADIRDQVGLSVITKSFKTGDPFRAEILAKAETLHWKDVFKSARSGKYDIRQQTKVPIMSLVEHRRSLKTLLNSDEEIEAATHAITDMIERGYNQKIYSDDEIEAFTGRTILFKLHLDDYRRHLEIEGKEAKTIDEQVSIAEAFIERHPTDSGLTQEVLLRYFHSLKGRTDTSTASPRTQNKHKTLLKKFFEFTGAEESERLLSKIKFHLKKAKKTNKYMRYTDEQIVCLRNTALRRRDKDPLLYSLIIIGAYTGARIEELCLIHRSQQTRTDFLTIPTGKHHGELRAVPIHSMIQELVDTLWESSLDDYLITGQTPDQYGDRSGAIGKRFGRLRSSLNIPGRVGFHSLRTTFIQKLKEARVDEVVVAEIVGHEHSQITFGHYGNVPVPDLLKEAIERLEYEGM